MEVLPCGLVLLIIYVRVTQTCPLDMYWIATLCQIFSEFPLNLHHYHCHSWQMSPLCSLGLSPPKKSQQFDLMFLSVTIQIYHLFTSRREHLLNTVPSNCNHSSSHRSQLFPHMPLHVSQNQDSEDFSRNLCHKSCYHQPDQRAKDMQILVRLMSDTGLKSHITFPDHSRTLLC